MAYCFIPEIFLCIYVLSIMFLKLTYNKELNHCIAIVMAMISCCICIDEIPEQSFLSCKSYELIIKFVILAASLLIYNFIGEQQFHKQILFFITVIGSLMAISSANFILMLISIEIAAMPICISLYGDRMQNKSYIVYEIIGSLILVFAIVMIYFLTGYTSFSDIRYAFSFLSQNDRSSYFIAVIILIAFCIKCGTFLSHFWIADLLDKSIASAAMAFCILRICIILAFYKIVANVFCHVNISHLISLIACISIFFGSIAIAVQREIKKAISYAIVYHSGISLLCCAAKSYTSIKAIAFFLISEIVTLIGIFILISNIKKNKNEPLEYISDFYGLSLWNPLLAVAVSVLFLSLYCFPPLIGFWSGYYACISMLNSDFLFEAAIYVISTMINLTSIGKILNAIWFKIQKEDIYFTSLNRQAINAVYFLSFMTIMSIPIANKVVSFMMIEINN